MLPLTDLKATVTVRTPRGRETTVGTKIEPQAPPSTSGTSGKPPGRYPSREDFVALTEAYRTLLTALVHEEGPGQRAKLLSALALLEGSPRG